MMRNKGAINSNDEDRLGMMSGIAVGRCIIIIVVQSMTIKGCNEQSSNILKVR